MGQPLLEPIRAALVASHSRAYLVPSYLLNLRGFGLIGCFIQILSDGRHGKADTVFPGTSLG